MTERSDQLQDSAGMDPLRTALQQQGAMLGHQASRLNAATQDVEVLNAQVAELLLQVSDLRRVAANPLNLNPSTSRGFSSEPEPHANSPPPYDGDSSSCRAFLSQCALVFSLQPRRYATEEARVAFVLTLLTGRAREWGVAVWEAGAPCCRSFGDFRVEMTNLFDCSARGDEAAAQLSSLSQGRRSITEYSITFQTLAAACDWNEGALRSRFLDGLNNTISDEIATLDPPRDLEGLTNLCLRVENRLNVRRRPSPPSWRVREANTSRTASNISSEAEPMQLGRSRLSPVQKQERLYLGLCFYCGKPDHQALHCPLKARAHP